MNIQSIRPQELAAKCQAGENIELIDVRTPIEFQEVHCTFARNIPLSDLQPQVLLQQRGNDKDKPIYLICLSGARGRKACEVLQAAGFTNIFNVEGGTKAWTAEGLPVNRGKKMISLQRQVQITAGSMILISIALGWLVHPYWLALAACVGAGLVVTGVTDTCAMGLLLAQMPWNRVACDVKPSDQPSGRNP